MIERAYFLGLAHTIRFYLYNKGYIEKPSFMDFDTVIEHPAFRDLPLRREEKKLARRGRTFIEKGRRYQNYGKKREGNLESTSCPMSTIVSFSVSLSINSRTQNLLTRDDIRRSLFSYTFSETFHRQRPHSNRSIDVQPIMRRKMSKELKKKNK